MHLITALVPLVALGALPMEFAAAAAIPGSRQAHFRVGGPPSSSGSHGLVDSLRFYRRRAMQHIGLEDDMSLFGRNHDDDVKQWNDSHQQVEHTPRKRDVVVGASVQILPSGDGDHGSLIYIGHRRDGLGHHGRRTFHRMVNSRSAVAESKPSVHDARNIPILDVMGIELGGLAGTIDIVSPTIDNPVGEKIASLAVSTEPSSLNQFILNASGTNASTIYLHVKTNTTSVGTSTTLTVTLQLPVYDESKTSYVQFCATFDTTQPSPLMLMECMPDEMGVTESRSQVFEYNPGTSIIRPLWLAANLIGQTPVNAADSGDTNNSTQPSESITATDETQTESPSQTTSSTEPMQSEGPLPLMKNVTSSGTDQLRSAGAQNVELMFTPEVDSSTPIVNSEAQTTDMDDNSQYSNDDSTSQEPSPTDEPADTTATETTAPVSTSTDGSPPADGSDPASESTGQDQVDSAAMPPLGTSLGEDASISGSATPSPTTSAADTPVSSADDGAPTSSSDTRTTALFRKPFGVVSRDEDSDEDDNEAGEPGSGDESGDGDDSEGWDDASAGGDDASVSSSSGSELRSVDTGYGWRFNPSTDAGDLVN